ncbi:hypothetical protein EV201_1232 [Ancylomarina subtilis]|uniref:Uncharacterized protein n=1 Tax=Ancylomarina subtilis TaxID=1639035 RepID=A0A4Q7VK76_9BACT|nr:hypothetical protein [Ancylomarina subtilis]RZT96592.1 hypothetical protein EV201_1232 [Ancylomarina subtilis]
MGTSIIFKKHQGKCILIDNEFYSYSFERNVFKRVSFSKHTSDYSDIIQSLKSKGFCFLDSRKEKKLVELNCTNIINNFYDKHRDFFVAIKPINTDDVSEFFDFELDIQIEGERIRSFYTMVEDDKETFNNDYITFEAKIVDGSFPADFVKHIKSLDAKFGPRYQTNNWHQSDQWRMMDEYRIHISRIEKIFLTKFFINPAHIGTDKHHEYNGKKEILELDLRNPDIDIYNKINAIENCVEIEWL